MSTSDCGIELLIGVAGGAGGAGGSPGGAVGFSCRSPVLSCMSWSLSWSLVGPSSGSIGCGSVDGSGGREGGALSTGVGSNIRTGGCDGGCTGCARRFGEAVGELRRSGVGRLLSLSSSSGTNGIVDMSLRSTSGAFSSSRSFWYECGFRYWLTKAEAKPTP